MEIEQALHELRRAALQRVAREHWFKASEEDVEFAMRIHRDLGAALNALLQRQNAAIRFGYATRSAYRKMNSWYSVRRGGD